MGLPQKGSTKTHCLSILVLEQDGHRVCIF